MKTSKEETRKKIESFFPEIRGKNQKEVLKVKKTAMSQNIKLGEKRKQFCKKCLTPYSGNEKIRLRNGIKSVECKKCGYIARWRIKLS